MMNCHEVKSRLGRYLDEEVSVQERLAIKQHVEKCPGCLQELMELFKIESQLRSVMPPPAPVGLTQRIVAKARCEPTRDAAFRIGIGIWRGWSRSMRFAATGTALLALCVGMLLSGEARTHGALDVVNWLPSASKGALVVAYQGVSQ
jgi:anti-sigma factor RsiW